MLQSSGITSLFVDLNTLEDFFGARPVVLLSNPERTRANLRELTSWLERHGEPLLSATDAHAPDAPEFAAHGLPPHGVVGTPGAARIRETSRKHAPVIPASGKRQPWPMIGELAAKGGQLVLEKENFDLFDNPAAREVLKGFGARELILFGGLFAYDLRATALSARTLGYEVLILEDAIGIWNAPKAAEVRGELARRGVRFGATDQALQQLAQAQRRSARLARAAGGRPEKPK
ncbi:MAG: isochorismatase family protein [Planctomycetota bacterium]|nr:isochorismatase family protein [Planctomycetota bacterium]